MEIVASSHRIMALGTVHVDAWGLVTETLSEKVSQRFVPQAP